MENQNRNNDTLDFKLIGDKVEKGDLSSSSSSSSSSSITSHHTSTDQSCRHSLQSSSSSLSWVKIESIWVFRCKLLVLLVISVAAIVCGTLAYRIVRNNEREAFRLQFVDFATEIADVSHVESHQMIQAVKGLSIAITSSALDTNSSFPLVTLPHFEAHGQLNNNVSRALQITYAPLVAAQSRDTWEEYATKHQGWIEESHRQSNKSTGNRTKEKKERPDMLSISPWIHRFNVDGTRAIQLDDGIDFGPWDYAPVWQQSPAPQDASIINFDLLSHPVFHRVFHALWETQEPVLSEVIDLDFLYGTAVSNDKSHPHSFLLEPVYTTLYDQKTEELAGILVAIMAWDSFLSNILHEGMNGVTVVVHDSCGDHFTYQLNGSEAVFVGDGDLHDKKYADLEVRTPFVPFLLRKSTVHPEHCDYDLRIYPTSIMEKSYLSHKPFWSALVVIGIFVCTAVVFLLFDYVVALRQRRIMTKAKRTNAIVSSLFPETVRERMLQEAGHHRNDVASTADKTTYMSTKSLLNEFLGTKSEVAHNFQSQPIADLFPSCTVLFADIVGFTAWSSTRQPGQVFTLLETLYTAFDEVATRRRVFKVETIGDCYVAVSGVPEPRRDHAIVMARFARDCREIVVRLTKEMETTLGPDTGDLSMRFGLHSGPVTAGVLRGDKARFQLFGDTVNTAARMESTGGRNRIHCSQETATLLEDAGKAWTFPRDEKVYAKGKGKLQTYWVEFARSSTLSRTGNTTCSDEYSMGSDDGTCVFDGPDNCATNEMIDLQKMDKIQRARMRRQESIDFMSEEGVGASVVDEVVDVIQLPDLSEHVEVVVHATLDDAVIRQVRHYIKTVSSMYSPHNSFHNFEHASHVTMSDTKLLSRIVAPTDVLLRDTKNHTNSELISRLHDHTYGITSDPLTQFACVFSALIHDIDHPGVPNGQLVKEQTDLAVRYKGKSVAEQNSVDIAWAILMGEEYKDLRQTIYETDGELKRFRQLVVNSVMATDIVDKELKTLRNQRWDRAFSPACDILSTSHAVNRKATIVIEHLIQASDVAHTMQHWHIYRKWNERFFHECYQAYVDGRSDQNPADGWYQGEIGFFDYYIIPLAKKLKECGVFGVSSDEYLNYAEKNREEWELRGQEVVARMVEKYSAMTAVKANAASSKLLGKE